MLNTVAMWHGSAEMMNVQAAVCRRRSTGRTICPRDQSVRQVRDQRDLRQSPAVDTASMTGSDPQASFDR